MNLSSGKHSQPRVLRENLRLGVVRKARVLGRSMRKIEDLGLAADPLHYERYRLFIESMDDEAFTRVMSRARVLLHEDLAFQDLTDEEKLRVRDAAGRIKVCFALVGFVIICFVTEAMPLPGVAFCIGLILVFSGIVGRDEVAALYWSDACWFIMGSLMFAAAFVKTGVDKRICLILFRYLAKPGTSGITAVLILVIAPAAAFISDHALAAIFLPIGIILYNNSLTAKTPEDPELGQDADDYDRYGLQHRRLWIPLWRCP